MILECALKVSAMINDRFTHLQQRLRVQVINRKHFLVVHRLLLLLLLLLLRKARHEIGSEAHRDAQLNATCLRYLQVDAFRLALFLHLCQSQFKL